MKQKWMCLRCLGILLIISFIGVASADTSGFTGIFIDVGQGDAALLLCDGEAMMVDTGPASAWDDIRDVLESEQVDKIKYLVATHPHQDHIANVSRVIEDYAVGAVILPPLAHATQVYNRMIVAVSEAEVEMIHPFVGDTFELGEAIITVYAPHPVAYSNPNDWSIVLMVRYADCSILLCGDAEYQSEMDMLDANDEYPLKADIIKVGHHGADTSSSCAFIEAVSPQYAVVSCGRDGEYPSTETAMTLYNCHVEDIWTTNIRGDIELHIAEAG